MSDETVELLKRCETALTDWVRSYAGELCHQEDVYESADRIMANGGTLRYIAELRRDILKHLAEAEINNRQTPD